MHLSMHLPTHHGYADIFDTSHSGCLSVDDLHLMFGCFKIMMPDRSLVSPYVHRLRDTHRTHTHTEREREREREGGGGGGKGGGERCQSFREKRESAETCIDGDSEDRKQRKNETETENLYALHLV